MERKLASLQLISNLEPIPGADLIEKATILGWAVVVKKGEFKVNDKVVYCEIDSVLPERTEFEFLRSKHFRIKTIKLKGQVSQGIVFPLSILDSRTFMDSDTGDDVTTQLGIKKYEPNIPAILAGKVKGNFPSFLHKTDETRIQSVPGVLTRHAGKKFVVTEKLDGSSMTVYYRWSETSVDGEFGVCSRNLDLKEDLEYGPSKNAFWVTARKLDLENKLKGLGGSYALQGELLGLGIQKNKYNLSELEFRIFNVFNIQEGKYLGYPDMLDLCTKLGLQTVPIRDTEYILPETVSEVVEYSKAKSFLNKDVLREGVVLRTLEPEFDEDLGRLSFKVINPEFLLKFED